MAGYEATGAVMSAYVDGSSATEEGDGEVFCGCLDVLLVSGDCGEAKTSVCGLSICYIVVFVILNFYITCLFSGIDSREEE